MTPLELAVLVIAGITIIGAVIEAFQLLTRSRDVKQARFLEETRAHRLLRTGEETDGTAT